MRAVCSPAGREWELLPAPHFSDNAVPPAIEDVDVIFSSPCGSHVNAGTKTQGGVFYAFKIVVGDIVFVYENLPGIGAVEEVEGRPVRVLQKDYEAIALLIGAPNLINNIGIIDSILKTKILPFDTILGS